MNDKTKPAIEFKGFQMWRSVKCYGCGRIVVEQTSCSFCGEFNGIQISASNNNIEHPQHYTSGSMEVFDIINLALEHTGSSGMGAACEFNIIKYLCRHSRKNGVEDLKKAKWYLEKLIKIEEKNNHQ